MDLSTALVADMRELLHQIDVDADVVSASATLLHQRLRSAISSYRGLQLIMYELGHPLTLTIFDPSTDRRAMTASLKVQLDHLVDVEPRGVVIAYAVTAGAFVDLAADLAYTLGVSQNTFALDDSLPPSTTRSGLTGIRELSSLNRAIGVLIDQGLDPEEARLRVVAAPEGWRRAEGGGGHDATS